MALFNDYINLSIFSFVLINTELFIIFLSFLYLLLSSEGA
jgi:hypothetical protein